MKLSLAIASLACLGYALASPLMAPLSHNRTSSKHAQVARALPPSRQDMEKEVLSILKSAKAKGNARACEQISDRDFVHNLDRNLSFAKRGSETWTETLRRLVKYQTVHETVAEVFPDDIVDIIRSIDTSLMNDGALIGPEQRTQKALEPILDGISTTVNMPTITTSTLPLSASASTTTAAITTTTACPCPSPDAPMPADLTKMSAWPTVVAILAMVGFFTNLVPWLGRLLLCWRWFRHALRWAWWAELVPLERLDEIDERETRRAKRRAKAKAEKKKQKEEERAAAQGLQPLVFVLPVPAAGEAYELQELAPPSPIGAIAVVVSPAAPARVLSPSHESSYETPLPPPDTFVVGSDEEDAHAGTPLLGSEG
ncbi:hypothetical protein SCAR479_05974 [Seiridium cardinale]|uniref:Uncharacterized protein n=1 Tax=Seiridium cardinale TaxID=138064 RepID=A0ABR2XU71_9PEZI